VWDKPPHPPFGTRASWGGLPRPPQGDEQTREAALVSGRRALIAGLWAIFFTLFFPPVGFVLGVVAVGQGVRALQTAKRAAQPAGQAAGPVPGAVSGIVAGTLSVVLCLAVLAFGIVNREPLERYSECMRGANTLAAEEECRSQLPDSIKPWADFIG
jgi:hypothetical protein